jgi:chaperonin GroES
MRVPSQEIKEDTRQGWSLYAQAEAVTIGHAANTARADSVEWSTWQAARRWLNQPGLRNVLALKGLYPSGSQAQELLSLGRGYCSFKLRFLFRQRVGEIPMKLKPIGDRIIVRRREQQDKTESGIYLPDTAKNKPQYGKVLAVGPGKLQKDGKRRSMQVKEGDTVLFTSWAGDEFREHRTKDEILVMREEDILAVVDE